MPVISFINQKGGCGKSTLSWHLANWLDRSNSVIVIDADAQNSIGKWARAIGSDIVVETILDADALIDRIPELRTEFDHVVIDGQGGLTETTRAIALRSDLIVIPVQPTGLDVQSSLDAIGIVKQAQSIRENGLPKMAIVLSRATPRTVLLRDAKKFFKSYPLMKTIVHQRQPIADCFGQGCLIWTLEPAADQAVQEINSFCKEIAKWLAAAKV